MNYLTQVQSRSADTTRTAARVRDVMVEVRADFANVAFAGLADYGPWMEWCEDLLYILDHGVAKSFQIQFTSPGLLPRALEYVVREDGSLRSSDKAGGINYYSLPAGTKARLSVETDHQNKNWPAVSAYLSKRGWGSDGHGITGTSTQDRVYSADGYGVSRAKIGSWE